PFKAIMHASIYTRYTYYSNARSGVDENEDTFPTPHISLCALARVDFWANFDVFDLERVDVSVFGLIKLNL
ncbi:MAG TPA: hypothetical protein VFQ43_08045, partial [Nitrososphaera sp.]|nr:hypothetical protein [Nitrososphaera sp.]